MPLPYTPLPQAPDRKRPTTFADEGDAFLGALPTFGSEMAAIGAQAEANAAAAATAAATATSASASAASDAASASASASSALNSPGTQATSTTSVVLGLGSKSFTIQTGKAFAVGQPVTIADNAAPGTNWMAGNISAHTPGTGAITVNVLRISGSGTIASWTIALAGPVVASTTLAGYGITDGVATSGDQTVGGVKTFSSRTVFGAASQEKQVAIAASNIDLALGNYFTRTISGATSLTVSNTPASGVAASFILDLTNGGAGAITWWANVKWAGGTAPTLTASGRDVLGFFTHNGGTTWTGLVLGKDVK